MSITRFFINSRCTEKNQLCTYGVLMSGGIYVIFELSTGKFLALAKPAGYPCCVVTTDLAYCWDW